MRYAFGECVVDTETRQLMRAGDEVRLSPKGFDLLVLLLDGSPRALRKLDLLRRIWPDTSVTESSLSTLIAEIRRALDDPAGAPRYIRTLHRHGYAFVAQVRRETSAAAPDRAAERPWCQLTWKGGAMPLGTGISVIGRASDVEVYLDHHSVSRRHARLTIRGGLAILEDLGSRNGTSLNGVRVTGAVEVRRGDRITVGGVVLVIEDLHGTTVAASVTRHE